VNLKNPDFVLRKIFAASEAYAKSSGEDPILVKSKRAMGITLGMAVIAHIQELGLWEEGGEHPAIAARVARLAGVVDLPGNDYMWNVACSFLLASLRRQGALLGAPAKRTISTRRPMSAPLGV
jgi:hypothetical protein